MIRVEQWGARQGTVIASGTEPEILTVSEINICIGNVDESGTERTCHL
jgi:hypothetical protein